MPGGDDQRRSDPTDAVAYDEEATRVAPPPEPSPSAAVEPEDESRVPGEESSARAAIAPTAALQPLLLERIEPSLGRGERVRLDAGHWTLRIGRAEHNDLRLYTATASRDHAVIAGNEAGEWVLTPGDGKSVAIDGYESDEPVVLEVGMNLLFGGDHLRCVIDGPTREQAVPTAPANRTSVESEPRRGGNASWWIIGGIAGLGVALILYAWFTG